MTNLKQKKKAGVSPVFAAVTGAVIGAGAAVAGAFALKDKKNRDKVKKVLTNVKNQAVGYIEKVGVKKDIVKNKAKAKVKKIVKISKDTKEKIKKEI